ncbi:hypothetical protein [Modestobacter sp. DSM 44400]|nr:hypothetical protein [Modestobacter sp. DSM 44400]
MLIYPSAKFAVNSPGLALAASAFNPARVADGPVTSAFGAKATTATI